MTPPEVERLRTYAADTRISVLCRETHIGWAIAVALENDRADLVQAYCQIRSDMRKALRV